MKFRLLFASLCLGAFVACQESTQKQQIVDTSSETTSFAKLYITSVVDLGDFDANNIMKSVTLEARNIGNDTLYILAVRPDCDCVEVAVADSVVIPGGSTTITASLNADGYLIGDSIHKQFVITSTSFKERHIRVTLKGLKK